MSRCAITLIWLIAIVAISANSACRLHPGSMQKRAVNTAEMPKAEGAPSVNNENNNDDDDDANSDRDDIAVPGDPPTPEGRIVGGSKTTIARHPYQASIRLDSSVLIHICGGSIYAPRVIITAAHCLKGRFASTIRVVVGSDTINDQTQQGVGAQKLIYHSGYKKKTHENDVGLIILREELVWSEVVQPIPLVRVYPRAGMNAVVTGWGKTDEDAEKLSTELQEVEVQLVDQNECHSQYKTRDYTITEEMVCAGSPEGGKDACGGDSGGPLAVNGRLLGIVSWGIGCARSEFPGVYASVPYHGEWIEMQAMPYL